LRLRVDPHTSVRKCDLLNSAHNKDSGTLFLLKTEKLVLLHLRETVAAINRPVGNRLKRNLCFAAAFRAHGNMKLSLGFALVFFLVAAGFASLGLVLEASLCVKFLLSRGERKVCSAISALKCFVLIHDNTSLLV
jgi:hypothetical protein